LENQQELSFVVSPQNWGKLFISKHHYAIELAKLGHLVYFIEPPVETRFFSIPKVEIFDTEYENLKVVKSKLFFSFYFKFHLAFLHHFLIRVHRKLLLRKLGIPSIVLSFDLVNNFPLDGLSDKRIFFAADEPKADNKLTSAIGSDLIVSVSQHILDIYQRVYPNIKKLLLNHGVADEFFLDYSKYPKKYKGINVGLSGNFMFNDIDYPTLIEIIKQNKEVNFHFYGPTKIEESNIGADISENYELFYDLISHAKNTTIHGVHNKLDLAKELNQMDAFLICYHPCNGQSSGSNSHKILEYLSTGKIIITSNFSHYEGTELFQMGDRKNTNLSQLFSDVIENLEQNNHESFQKNRKLFAQKNSYSNQVQILLETLSQNAKTE
jgi:hypothetical protein